MDTTMRKRVPLLAGRAALGVAVAALIFPMASAAETAECSAAEAIRRFEEDMRGDGQVAQLEMRVVRPESTRTLRMRFWFQNRPGEAQDRSLARVEAPAAERGVASLRIGQKRWSFVPSTGRVQQVPESMMMGSWMGSDWTNDDLVRESSLLDDYRVVSSEPADLDGTAACRIEVAPRPGREVTWPKLVTWFHRSGPDAYVAIKQEFYSRRAGELVLARTMEFSAIRDFGGRRIPSRMVLLPAGRPGRRTELRYLALEFDAVIPETLFSLTNLQRAR
jgi:hypothetical protein